MADESEADGLAADEKVCPFCAEVIKAAAVLCRFCQSRLDDPASLEHAQALDEPPPPGNDEQELEFLQQWWDDFGTLNVALRLTNTSDWYCSYYVDVYLVDSAGTRIGHTNQMVNSLAPGRGHQWESPVLMTDGQPETFEYSVTTYPQAYAPDEAQAQMESAAAQAEEGEGVKPDVAPEGVWVEEVKGTRFMAAQGAICHCAQCGHTWRVTGEYVGALAQLQSLGGKLQKWGTSMQHAGNVMTPGIGTLMSGRSGRRKAQGQAVEAEVRSQFRCARCKSDRVRVAV